MTLRVTPQLMLASFLMSYVEFKNFAAALASLATVGAFVIGGIWAIRRLIVQRENVPHLEFNVDMQFVGIHRGRWICAVTATLRNEGLVRHEIGSFTFSVRTLLRSDAVITDSKLGDQVVFPNKIVVGSWLPRDRDYTFVEPKVESRYSYVTSVSRDAAFVLVHGRFTFRSSDQFQTADMVVRVPAIR